MTDYSSNLDLAQAADKILDADHIAITTHSKPDGDAYGSVVAVAAALSMLGRQVSARFIPPVPSVFDDLKGRDLVSLYNPSAPFPPADLLLVLDTGAWSQLSPMREALSGLLERTLIIDHHTTGDLPAAHRYIDSSAAACCEIVAQLIEQIEGKSQGHNGLFTPAVCEALFVGVASDTGWFRFSNTRPQSHELAGRLLRLGVDQADIYSKLEQTARPEKLALQTRALNSLQFLAEGRVAIMVLRAEDFTQTGAKLEETERFVDMPQSVSTVDLVVLITEPPSHKHPGPSAGDGADEASPNPVPSGQAVRLSFRSKPGPNGVNVSQLAQRFGGGGHARAAGAKVHVTVDQAISQVQEAVMALVNGPSKG